MKTVFLSAIAACVFAVLTPNAGAQDNESTTFIPAQIIVTPHVTPPKESLESGLGGTVRVKISIDSAGMVTSADDATGPDHACRQVTRTDVVAMRSAAKEAAMTAKFNPATDKGKPVASSTWLSFKFPGSGLSPGYNAAPSKTEPTAVSGSLNNNDSRPPQGETSAAPQPEAQSAALTAKGEASNKVPKMIRGGVLNGKATSLPKPEYPAAARAVRASGSVNVEVLIDDDGSVFSAKAVSGHPLLRGASAIAACDSQFSPTQLSGNPVKVVGVVTYNFVP